MSANCSATLLAVRIRSCCIKHGVCAGKCPPIGAYAAAAAGIASPDDFRAFLDPFVGAMASSRVELAAALEVVRSAVADGDDLAPLFSVWSGLERQAITKAVANSAVTAGAMPSTEPRGSSSEIIAPSPSRHRTAPTRWAHRAVGCRPSRQHRHLRRSRRGAFFFCCRSTFLLLCVSASLLCFAVPPLICFSAVLCALCVVASRCLPVPASISAHLKESLSGERATRSGLWFLLISLGLGLGFVRSETCAMHPWLKLLP